MWHLRYFQTISKSNQSEMPYHFPLSSLSPFITLFFFLLHSHLQRDVINAEAAPRTPVLTAECFIHFKYLGEAREKNIHSLLSQRSELYAQAYHKITSLQWVNGRRCLFVPSKNVNNRNEAALEFDLEAQTQFTTGTADDELPPPPVVILGGMAQSISSWAHHLPMLSKERDIFLCEYLGSGLGFCHPEFDGQFGGADDLGSSQCEYYKNVSLTKQAQELEAILQKSFPRCAKFDLVGFSLGARIGLATIALFPTLIRKAHLTGVGIDRSPYAKIVIRSWKEMLQSGMKITNICADENDSCDDSSRFYSSILKPFAWSIIMTTYSQEFLASNGPDKISAWVNHICDNNNPVGLLNLLEQTHGDTTTSPPNRSNNDSNNDNDSNNNTNNNEMREIVQQIRKNRDIHAYSESDLTLGQIHMGELDEISTIDQARELNSMLGWNDQKDSDIIIYKACGHAVMNEAGQEWRKSVNYYLNT